MSLIVTELRDIREELQIVVDRGNAPGVVRPLDALEESANAVAKSWSHSWLGYQSTVYYDNLTSPPPGAHFSIEWGFTGRFQGTTGDWMQYDPDVVSNAIFERAGAPDLTTAEDVAARAKELFEEKRSEVASILEAFRFRHSDSFVEQLLDDAKKAQVFTKSDFIDYLRPSGTQMSRDSVAITQGLWTPPHIDVLAEVTALRNPVKVCAELAKIAHRAASHIERIEREAARTARIGTNVFIGHGRSPVWKDLKDFVQERLHLPWDEFNRVPVAGVTNIARLSEMLEAAAIAFIVMTAEDEQPDEKVRARMNVIHEVGLFQGRLGFTKAIVLLEDGCEEFSNIQGLGQIRFPKGNIKAVFEEIRQVLEREGVLDSG